MDKSILTTVITGIFSLAAALGSVWLKDLLERRRLAFGSRPGGAEVPATPPTAQPRSRGRLRPLFVFLGGFALGIINRALEPFFGSIHWVVNWVFVIIIGGVAFRMALSHRRSGASFWPYELEVSAIWTAWAAGWSLVHGGVWDATVRAALFFWLICAVVGGAIVLTGGKYKRAT